VVYECVKHRHELNGQIVDFDVNVQCVEGTAVLVGRSRDRFPAVSVTG
jgi:hypothetical protein